MENYPEIFSSFSEMARTVIGEYIEGELVHSESGPNSSDIESILKKLGQVEQNIIDEIKKTRAEIRSASSLRDDIKRVNADKIKEVRVRQLKKLWLEDPEITTIKTKQELEQYFNYEYDYLAKYAADTIALLDREGYLSLSMTDKITWNKELLE